jgi:two-component system, LytTR family, sensor kinase
VGKLNQHIRKKLYQYALALSPIIALYGVAPIYVFKILELKESSYLFFGLAVNVFVQWAICIKIYQRIDSKKELLIYAYNIIIAVVLHLPKMFFDPVLPFGSKIQEYVVYPLIIGIAITILIITICKSVILNQKNVEAEIEINQLKIQNLEAQKQTLMQQLQPHFLFNSLSVLKSLIKENANKAEEYSIKLSEFLRYSVESHKTELVSLENELEFVNNYIELQKVRFENAFQYNVSLPEEIKNYQIPVFALQTLVENAFKHNYFTEKKPLSISVDYENEKLKVVNNKVSIKLVEKTNTGLMNLDKRYKLFGNSGIEISETEDTFCVTIGVIRK